MIREPAVAGMFYPANPTVLRSEDERYLQEAYIDPELRNRAQHLRALMVPHAGHVYSGPVAAKGYALLRAREKEINQISTFVILGPNHTVPMRGIALPQSNIFETPLGRVPVNAELANALEREGYAQISDIPHRKEHCLEVQLPFLQLIMNREFSIVPMVVGEVSPEWTSSMIDFLAKDDGVFFLISSDLSHYEPYESARAHDARSLEQILRLEPSSLAGSDACGVNPLSGFLLSARQNHWEPVLLDYRNSGDTAGDKWQVVGYASVAFFERSLSHDRE